MTSEEKMQEEYEKFMGKSWHCHIDMTNRMIWENAWKSSRESLVIELPLKEKDMAWMDDYDSGCVYGRNAAIESCKYAIHAAGVKTK